MPFVQNKVFDMKLRKIKSKDRVKWQTILY